MTAVARNGGVFALQRVGGRRVVLNSELARLESLDGVAGRTLTLVGPCRELAVVRVRLVAVHAPLECQRLFKIAAAMALQAIHLEMLALQRVLGFGMVKFFVDRGHGDPFPTIRAMT